MSIPLVDERPRMFRSDPVAFVIAVALIAAYGLGLLILAAWWIRSIGERLVVTESKVLLERGILSKNRTELAIGSIRTVNVHQSPFNRMFDTGRISVFTAGDKPEIVISGIDDPNRIRELIMDRKGSGVAPVRGAEGLSFRKERPEDNETLVFRGGTEIGSIVEHNGIFTYFGYDGAAEDGLRRHEPHSTMTACKAWVIKRFS